MFAAVCMVFSWLNFLEDTMSNYKFETLQLHVGQEQPDPATDARAVPIYATTSYVFQDCAHAAARFNLSEPGNIYSRLTNSTQAVFEQRIAALEGGVAALALASGSAAITYVIQALAQNGGHIVAQKSIYGGTYNLLSNTLKNFGITTSFVDIHNLAEVEAAIQENTRGLYIETLGNPNSDIPDVDALAALAHKHGIPLVVDNTFGTPFLFRPIEHGADIVVHSATKFIGGHGTTLGGIVVEIEHPCGSAHFQKPHRHIIQEVSGTKGLNHQHEAKQQGKHLKINGLHHQLHSGTDHQK